MTTQPQPAEQSERERFEAWALSEEGGWWPDAIVRVGDCYKAGAVTKQWNGWQARAALSKTESDALDAARYRWLRDHSNPGICTFYLSVGKAFDGVKFARETVDQAVDAQIAAMKGTP